MLGIRRIQRRVYIIYRGSLMCVVFLVDCYITTEVLTFFSHSDHYLVHVFFFKFRFFFWIVALFGLYKMALFATKETLYLALNGIFLRESGHEMTE